MRGDVVNVKTTSPVSFGPLAGSRARRSPISGAFLIVLLALAWMALAPVQVGGRASYVIVNGNSMEPVYSKGDLVVTHEKDEYRKGDIAAYLHPDIGPVIHRVVGTEGERFVFRGDNNTWLDSHQPAESEFIGKAWVHIPYVGKLLGWLRGPMVMAVLAGTMGVIAMMTFTTTRETSRDQRRQPPANRRPTDKRAGPSRPPGNNGEGVITMLAAVLFACLLLGFFAFTRPASVPVSGDAAYRHTGEFHYSAETDAAVYDESRVQTGEPVFRKVSEAVEVGFRYRLDTGLPAQDVRGAYRVVAEVSDVNGWKRTIVLQPHTPFTGGEFDATSTLALSDVQGIITDLEKQTGLHTNRYTVAVMPEVTLYGTLAGQQVEDEFSPRLDFWFDPLQLQLQTPVNGSATDPIDAGSANPLEPSESGSVKSATTEPNIVSILMFELGVWKARVLSLLGVALSAAGLVWLGVPMLRAQQSSSEPTRIRARYGGQLVAVGNDPCENSPVIEVATFEDLAKIAETSPGGGSILHRSPESEGGLHDYCVQGAGAVYRYQTVG